MQDFDFRMFTLINHLAGNSHLLDLIMIYIAKGGAALYGLILLGLFFSGKDKLSKTENRKVAIKAVFSAVIALLINQIIGVIYFRPRPFAHHIVNLLVDRSPDPSFPSDHATGSSSLTFSVLGSNRKLGLIMFSLMLILTFSRVYIGTHYPLDILGGVLTGLVGSFIANKLWPLINPLVTKMLEIAEQYILLGSQKKAS